MILDIPYYSQQKDVKDLKWKNRACGMTCIKMLLVFFQKQAPTLDNLIEESFIMNGYDKNFGWKHDALTNILRNYGVSCFRQEFKSKKFNIKDKNFQNNNCENILIDLGIDKIEKALLKEKPVIVSVSKNFSEEDKFHIIVLSGLELEEGIIKGFYYNDPDFLTEKDGKNRFVPMHIFRKHWRQMSIFVD